MLIFPDGLDVVFKKVDVGADGEFCGSFEVLIVAPEVLDGGYFSDGEQAILKVISTTHEVLIPELQFLR